MKNHDLYNRNSLFLAFLLLCLGIQARAHTMVTAAAPSGMRNRVGTGRTLPASPVGRVTDMARTLTKTPGSVAFGTVTLSYDAATRTLTTGGTLPGATLTAMALRDFSSGVPGNIIQGLFDNRPGNSCAGTFNITLPAGTYVAYAYMPGNDPVNATSNAITVGAGTPAPNPTPTPVAGSGTGTGLLGSYYNNMTLSGSPVVQRIDATVNFTWDGGGPSPAAGVNPTFMSVRWTGQIEAPVSGTYKFSTYNDDATRLTINGQQIINDWPGGHPTQWFDGSINLTAGQRYTVVLDFNQGYGGAQSQLYWEYPEQGRQILPQGRLYPDNATTQPTPPTTPAPTSGALTATYSAGVLTTSGTLPGATLTAMSLRQYTNGAPGNVVQGLFDNRPGNSCAGTFNITLPAGTYVAYAYVPGNDPVNATSNPITVTSGSAPIIVPMGVRPLPVGDPNRSPTWVWTSQTYSDVYYDSGIGGNGTNIVAANGNGVVTSPFWDATQTSVGYREQADMYPEDGWMLVARDFGTKTAAQPYPFFALYNKYKGVLRVAIWQSAEKSISSYHSISLSLQQNNNLPPSLLFADPDINHGFVGEVDYGYTSKVIAVAGRSEWMIADFNVAGYNGSDFNSAAAFIINIADIDQTSLTATGDITLNGTVQPGASGSVLDDIASINGFNAKSLEAVINASKKVAKNAEKFTKLYKTDNILEFISSGYDLVSGLEGGASSFKVNLMGGVALKGTLKTARNAGSFSIYLKSQVGDAGYSPVQTIPWGIVGVMGTGGLGQALPPNPYNEYVIRWTNIGPSESNYYVQIPPIYVDYRFNTASGLRLVSTRVGFPFLAPDINTYQQEFIAGTNNRVGWADSAVALSNKGYSPPKRRVNTNYLKNDWPYVMYYGVADPYRLGTIDVSFIFKPIAPTRRQNDSTVIHRLYYLRNLSFERYSTGARKPTNDYTEDIIRKPFPNPFTQETTIPVRYLMGEGSYNVQIYSLNGTNLWCRDVVISDGEIAIKWNGKTDSGSKAPPGVYICVVKQANKILVTHKIIIQP